MFHATCQNIRAFRLFFFILQHVPKMASISLRAFIEALHKVIHDVTTDRQRNGSDLLPNEFPEFLDGPGSP